MPIVHGPGGLSIIGEDYESKEFNVSDATTDYNVKTQQTAFANFKQAHHLILRTDQEITVKFNKTTKDGVTVEGGSVLTTDGLLITNVFITNNSGSTAAVKILMN